MCGSMYMGACDSGRSSMCHPRSWTALVHRISLGHASRGRSGGFTRNGGGFDGVNGPCRARRHVSRSRVLGGRDVTRPGGLPRIARVRSPWGGPKMICGCAARPRDETGSVAMVPEANGRSDALAGCGEHGMDADATGWVRRVRITPGRESHGCGVGRRCTFDPGHVGVEEGGTRPGAVVRNGPAGRGTTRRQAGRDGRGGAESHVVPDRGSVGWPTRGGDNPARYDAAHEVFRSGDAGTKRRPTKGEPRRVRRGRKAGEV